MESIECHGLKIDLDNKICYLDEQEINFSKKEFEIIQYLVQNPNKVISREDFLSKFWTKKVDVRSIDTAISRIRKKLGPDYGERIRTRQGFGYTFNDK